MGKEWNWSTKSSARADHRDCSSKESGSVTGCMGGMFHYLHFHHLLFTANSSCSRAPLASSQSSSSSPVSLPERVINGNLLIHTGLEAPRNSLELDHPFKALPIMDVMEEQFKDVPVAIEIVPVPPALLSKINNEKLVLVEEEKRNSQTETPRTPSLVARLMGLEIPAEQSSSPTPRINNAHESVKKMIKNAAGDQRRRQSPPPRHPLGTLNCNIPLAAQAKVVDFGSRSLPDSPRASSARFHDLDRWLSLQINKESTYESMHEFNSVCTVTVVDDSRPPPPKSWRKDSGRYVDENKSPSSNYHHAFDLLAEQVNESTNIGRRDEMKSKSRRTRLPEMRAIVPMVDQPPSRVCVDDGTKITLLVPPYRSLTSRCLDRLPPSKTPKAVQSKCKKADFERFTGRIKKPINARSLPTLASLFQSPDSQPQRNPHDTTISSSSLPPILTAPRLVKETSHALMPRPFGTYCRGPELSYIKSILEHEQISGFHTLRWYSRSLPVDPIIFHRLEVDLPIFLIGKGSEVELEIESRRLLGPLRHRCNRKLLFHLVQEILTDISSPSSASTAAATSLDKGEELFRQLVARIESFPAADCRVLGDIDDLIAGDLAKADVRRLQVDPSVVEEAGDVVMAVEREILESLLVEIAAQFALPSSDKVAVRLLESTTHRNITVPNGINRGQLI